MDASTSTFGSENADTQRTNSTQNQSANERFLKDEETTYFFTGTVERILTWSRVFKRRCYFEVIATVLSLQDGPIDYQKVILLKDKKGPILQVTYYVHHDIEHTDIAVGQMLRCVGYMTGINTLTAVGIREATSEEVTTLKRYCYIGDFTISGIVNAEDNQ